MKLNFFFTFLLLPYFIHAKEIALTFDDSPMPTSRHFKSHERTDELIRKLKELKIPKVIIFANPCKREGSASVISQLKKYREAGHLIGNHTCTHPRLDEVGFDRFSQDAALGDKLLGPLFLGQKFFRFPYLNESNDVKLRDKMRQWLIDTKYRNAMVSVDNDDYIFSFKINQAKEKDRKVNYKKVEELFVGHLIGAANFYNDLAVKTIGRSPKHVILLHEMDATVMFIEPLVAALRKDGWKIISVDEAYEDKIYLEEPKNTYAGNGIIAQLNFEKTGKKVGYNHFDKIKVELNRILYRSSKP